MSAGVGQGLQQAGALQWELAKEQRLEAIRQRERQERREDARLDREARKTDAKELAKWERDNAGKYERVNLEDGTSILRHSVTGDEKLAAGADRAKLIYSDAVDFVKDAMTQYPDESMMPESVRDRFARSLSIIDRYQGAPTTGDGPATPNPVDAIVTGDTGDAPTPSASTRAGGSFDPSYLPGFLTENAERLGRAIYPDSVYDGAVDATSRAFGGLLGRRERPDLPSFRGF